MNVNNVIILTELLSTSLVTAHTYRSLSLTINDLLSSLSLIIVNLTVIKSFIFIGLPLMGHLTLSSCKKTNNSCNVPKLV